MQNSPGSSADMSDEGSDRAAPRLESKLNAFAKWTELHLTDLEMFHDEIRKVRDLLSETVSAGEEAQKIRFFSGSCRLRPGRIN